MKLEKIDFTYQQFSNIEELTLENQALVQKALAAKPKAYAPYSLFEVACSVQLKNGEVIVGNNQENAAYPSGLCAERVAVFYAQSTYPNAIIEKIAIVAGEKSNLTNQPITPCGACRQVLIEIEKKQNQPIEVILVGKVSVLVIESISSLLPLAFNGDDLPK